MRHARLSTAAVAALLAAGLLGGCANAPDAPRSPATGANADSERAVATVSRSSITSVVTVAATVTAGASVTVTAPARGTVRTLGERSVEYTLDDGGRHTVKLPEGLTISRRLVSPGDRVPAHYPVAEARVAGFALVAPLDQAALYKLYASPRSARGQINEGPGPFDCPLADSVPSRAAGDQESAEPNSATAASVTCLIPTDLPVFAGMQGIVALAMERVDSALVLPVEAVAGTVQQGSVLLEGPDGRTRTQKVELGPTDGARIQIRSGLKEGDQVRIPGPGLTGGGPR